MALLGEGSVVVVVSVEALDIENNIQDGKDHGTEGQEVFIPLEKPTVNILRSAAGGTGSGWCLDIGYFSFGMRMGLHAALITSWIAVV